MFVQVFKAIGGFRGEAKLSTWIFRIAVNLSKNRTKYLARRRVDSQDHFDGVGDDAPLHGAKDATMAVIARPDELVERHRARGDRRALDRAARARVPRGARSLRDVEDMSYEEIADITGLADGTVKSRIHRARLQLKEAVELALGREDRMTDEDDPKPVNHDDVQESVRSILRRAKIRRAPEVDLLPACSAASASARAGGSMPTAGAAGARQLRRTS